MNKRRLALIALGLGGLLALAGLVFALVFAKPLAKRLAVERAAEHGVVLSPNEVSLGFGKVTLRGSSFELRDFAAVRGTIRELEVSVSWTRPVGIRLSGVDVEAIGSAPTLVLGATEWTKRYPHTFRLPTEAGEVTWVWRKAAGSGPWLTLGGGRVQRSGALTSFSADKSVLGVCSERDDGAPVCPDLGKVGAAWTADEAQVSIGFGVEDVGRAPVRLEVKHALAEPTADITLTPVDLSRLAGPFGVKLPVKNVTASATVHLIMPKGLERGAVTGTLDAALKGYVPPHPRELDGFVFGDTTTLSAKLRVDDARERADLSEVRVTAGAFKLGGTGSVFREADHGAVRLDLTGSLPCSALAGAAADSYLGKALGGIAGGLARQFVKGNVGVTVAISARSDDLANAKVTKKIGIGCGLAPLKLGDVEVDVGKILEGKLPPLPSALPGLPKLDIEVGPPPKKEPPKDPPKSSPQ